MSYAPETVRPHARTQPSGGTEAPARPGTPWRRRRGAGRPYTEQRDWARAGFFGAGLALGALLGAGAALLYAPQSGFETRTYLVGRARRMRARATDRWDELGAELRSAARRNTRRVRRGIVKGRWAAADSLDY
jgi:hypothetical protein